LIDRAVLESATSQLEQHVMRVAQVIYYRIRTEPGEICVKPGTVAIGERFRLGIGQLQDRLDDYLPSSLRIEIRVASTPKFALVSAA
jgi:hypothetical protein